MRLALPSSLGQKERIALQFSGGKDSLAVAYLLRPHWDRLTFYHVDTGDLLPEVREIVAKVERDVPRFVRVETNSAAYRDTVGLPSDLVPTTNTQFGLMIGHGNGRRIVDRFECCAHNIMVPMHNRMLEDGITLVIRGTKRADMPRLPHEGGQTEGYYLWLPIVDWSDSDVFAYLREVGAPICRVYENGAQSPECATCPAWWSEGRAKYLGKYHQTLNAAYQANLRTLRQEINPHYAALLREARNG